MKYRKLRIAWSVAWGVLGLLLIAFSVRSFTWADQCALRISSTYDLMVGSQLGGVFFFLDPPPNMTTSIPIDLMYEDTTKPVMFRRFYFHRRRYGGGIPHWFLALTCAITATIPWKPWKWKFSLRTLLVVMAVVAVIFGLVVWPARGL